MLFKGQFGFLSNYWETPVYGYPSVEHAYQACKTVDPAERRIIQLASTPAESKRLGRKLTMRPGWDEMKVQVMETLLRKKFENPALLKRLKAVQGEIVEDNWWGDRFWGVCNGTGRNELGKLLMKIRGEL